MRYQTKIQVGNHHVMFFNRNQLVEDDLESSYVWYTNQHSKPVQVMMVPGTYVEKQEDEE